MYHLMRVNYKTDADPEEGYEGTQSSTLPDFKRYGWEIVGILWLEDEVEVTYLMSGRSVLDA